MQAEVHEVGREPLTLIIVLPNSCSPGRWGAAEAYANTFSEIQRRYPNNHLEFIPFRYELRENGEMGLSSILAVGY